MAAAVRVAAVRIGLWVPPDTTRPRIHITARTRSRRAVFPSPGPRLWEGPGSRAPVARGGGLREHRGPGPGVEAVRPLPRPFPCPGLAPPALLPLGPRGSQRLLGAQRAGLGGGWGPRAPGREAVQLCAGESLDVGNSLPTRPAERRGRAGARRRHPGYPCGGRLAPPKPPPAGCSSGPGGSLLDGQPLLGGYPAAPPAAPRALTSGSGPGLPPVLPPQGAAWGGSLGAGRRASPEPGGRPEEPEGERAREGKPRRRVRACV